MGDRLQNVIGVRNQFGQALRHLFSRDAVRLQGLGGNKAVFNGRYDPLEIFGERIAAGQ